MGTSPAPKNRQPIQSVLKGTRRQLRGEISPFSVKWRAPFPFLCSQIRRKWKIIPPALPHDAQACFASKKKLTFLPHVSTAALLPLCTNILRKLLSLLCKTRIKLLYFTYELLINYFLSNSRK